MSTKRGTKVGAKKGSQKPRTVRLGVPRITAAQAAAQARQILATRAEVQADNAERVEVVLEEVQASQDLKHGGPEQKRAVEQDMKELTAEPVPPMATAPAVEPRGFQRRSLRSALATGIKAIAAGFTTEEKKNLAPLDDIRGSRINTIDEKKLKTYLEGNQAAYDALVAITTDLVGKKSEIQKRVSDRLKAQKALVVSLMFVPKTEQEKIAFDRLARNRQERLQTQLEERKERLRASRALVQNAIEEAKEGKAPALQQVTRTPASTAVEAEGKAPVLAQDPELDGKHTRPGGEAINVRGRSFAPLNDAEAKRTSDALLRRLPVEQRTVVRPFLAGLNRVLTGRTSVSDYAGTISTGAAIFLLGGFFNLLPSLTSESGRAAFRAIEAIIPLMGLTFRNRPALRGIVGEDGSISRESVQNIDLTNLEENTESMNRQEILSSLALAQGALVQRVNEGKASQDDVKEFRDVLNLLWQRSATNTTPNQLRLIRGLANSIRDADDVKNAIDAMSNRLIDSTTADDAKSALYRGNRALYEGYNPVDIYNVVQAMRDAPDNQGVADEILRARVFNAMLEGRQGSLEAKRLFAESGNLGGVEASEAQVRNIVQPSPTILERIREAPGLPIASITAVARLLQTGDINAAAINLAFGATGASAGGRIAEQRGMDSRAGEIVGAVAGNVVDYISDKFTPKPITIDPATRIPVEQVTVEQQEDVKNAANAIKGSGTLKPKFIVPSSDAFKPTPAENSVDQLEFDMFDYIRPTSEGDGFTIAESNIKMEAYRNEQMRMNGGGMTYAPSWGEQSFDADDEPINPKITEAMVRGDVIPADQLKLPTMETDFGDYEPEEHQWNPSVALQRLYASQPTPITGLNTTINESLVYGIVP